jgi:GT2 family glycosyltransferase
MMIDKDYFLEVGQFDKAYIKGDFEDADLCLKVRWLGGRVGLYKTNDIYHLERQSIRLMGGESSRLALTYLNCITFNERWSKFIREQKPAEMPGANVTALAAHKKARAV